MLKLRFSIMMLALVIVLVSPGTVQAEDQLNFDHYYDSPATYDALKHLSKSYPHLTELRSIGKSEEGRDVWLLIINNPDTGKDGDKPAIYVDGAIHGNEIQATEVCLYLANYLLESYETIPMIHKIVDECAFYIIPIVNVDGRDRFFTDAGGYNIGRTARVPHDDDRDGLVDEDDYDDVNGDGEILQMRVKDPAGGWKSHPDDPRVMIRIKPGQKGEWRLLGSEGIDNDEDGRLNEDTPGYLDMNRNYGFKWQPRYVQNGGGDYPMSGMVTKAISDFILTRENICFNVAFHNTGGMILRGPGSKLSPMYPPSDIKMYDYLGKEGEKILPGYKYMIVNEDLYTTHGDFDEWMYSNLGIFGFVPELYMIEQEKYRGPGEEEKTGSEEEVQYGSAMPNEERQKFNDFVAQGVMFSEWTPFEHPQFGKVEIGGWRTLTTRIPPTFFLAEMLHRNASFVILLAKHAPRITLEVLEVKALGGDLHRVRIRASNANAIPTLSSMAINKNLVRKDIMSIEGENIEVQSGGVVEDRYLNRIQFVDHRPWMVFTSVPSFGDRIVQWIVKGKGDATVTFDSKKAKNNSIEIKF